MAISPEETDPIRAVLAERLLQLEGGRNFRDLGGYATQDGKHIRWRRLYRSGSMHGLTQADYAVLAQREIRRVFDLRANIERQLEPNLWSEAAGLAVWTGDYTSSFADLQRVMASPLPAAEEARAAMIAGFRELPFDHAEAYTHLFKYIASGETPIVINCSAGKDRTGTAVAVLLAALGVPRETIIADFVLTDHATDLNRAFAPKSESKFNPFATIDAKAVHAILRADPAYVEAALDSVEERCGSVEGFVRDVLGISRDELNAVRQEVLE
jgi:protein-tyrosine phosphatase